MCQLTLVMVAVAFALDVDKQKSGSAEGPPQPPARFVTARHCRECHQYEHDKWATSRHGLAMRPFTPDFADDHLVPQAAAMEVRGRQYSAEFDGASGVVREDGPDGRKEFPIEHVLGGKNVFYFLTPWHRGRYQVLPLAFDVHSQQWYDMADSIVRHFNGEPGEALAWTDRRFTFNATCYSCHVSQLSKNYSFETDTYHTVWAEPGINCDTCHGPGSDHVRTISVASDHTPTDLRIIQPRQFAPQQINSMCAPCHAKMVPITTAFQAGADFFDHYNLVTLEDRDFYPDGRDLGENFTYTLWRLSPCVAAGKLTCMHCHTSSGRNKHIGDNADKACLPCHQDLVAAAEAHSHHQAGTEASRCVACHMPQTTFARMRRHDHSMLPPTPAATIAFGSPNACNVRCHTDRDAHWADRWVRKWYSRDYQAPVLHRAGLVDAARKGDWTVLPAIVAYLTRTDRDEIYATSLIRLLNVCPSPEKWSALLAALHDPSPLVRSAAALGLSLCPDATTRDALIAATADSSRLVRTSAACALNHHPSRPLDDRSRANVVRAFAEYEAAMRTVPDDPAAHYNLGVYYQNRGRLAQAADAYEASIRLEPKNLASLVNLSMVYAGMGASESAERALRQALEFDPTSAAANFNLGLLLAEQGHTRPAQACFRTALNTQPDFAEAAHNLGLLLTETQLDQAIAHCRKALDLQPDESRYACALATCLRRDGQLDTAATVLRRLLDHQPAHAEVQALLASIEQEAQKHQAQPPGRPD